MDITHFQGNLPLKYFGAYDSASLRGLLRQTSRAFNQFRVLYARKQITSVTKQTERFLFFY